jgi:hypothetical protein
MVKNKLNIFLIIVCVIFCSKYLVANPNSDQWMDTDKSYKDLIEEGFEVKAYATNTIETNKGIKLLLFVTVLQKNNEIYECQEYQTLDDTLETLDMQLICRELVQPYERGLGT